MIKSILLLSGLIFFSGCAERGYKLTVNRTTGTVTAEQSIDIRQKTKESPIINTQKMQNAVKQEQSRNKSTRRTSTQTPQIVTIMPKQEKTTKKQNRSTQRIKQDTLVQEEELRLQKDNEAKAALEIKLAKEKEEAELARKTAQEKALAQKQAEDEKRLLAMKEERGKKDLQRKLEQEEKIRLAKQKEKELQQLEAEKALAAKKREALQQKLDQEAKIRLAKQKEEQKRLLALQKQRENEALQRKLNESKKMPVSTTESLIFKPSTQTYQRFGTSEIHGHVIYLTSAGVEIFLKNTKIYLVEQNTKIDYWYNNYYLKNTQNSGLTKNVVSYLNATKLNLERNFAFYGLAEGNYYVIIESDAPKSLAKNNKVYIAKRVTVQKYKKIMTVFSKKF